MEVFITIFSGVVVFVIQNLILKLSIEPAKEFKMQIASTSSIILENMPQISNASSSEELSIAISKQSAQLLARSELIMLYPLFARIYKLPSQCEILSVCLDLNVISGNMNPSYQLAHAQQLGMSDQDLASQNLKRLRSIAPLLKIRTIY